MAEGKEGEMKPRGESSYLPREVSQRTFAMREAKRRRNEWRSGREERAVSEAADGFTLSRAVDQLVNTASRLAAAGEGSDGVAAPNSQKFHIELRERVQSFFCGCEIWREWLAPSWT